MNLDKDMKDKELREHGPVELHLPFFVSWIYARAYVCEMLLAVDTIVNVLTLGMLEINLSVLWHTLMEYEHGNEEE